MDNRKQYKLGMFYAVTCSVLWGFLPIYWQLLRPIESDVIIFYRIFLVSVVCFIAALKVHGWKAIKAPLREKGVLRKFFIAGLLITINWSIYIWAVNANYVIQTCIGYYIEPLMVCVFGIFLFKEKLTKFKVTALVFAGVGVLIVLLHFREVPLIALSLAISFAIYAALKKSTNLPALLSLLYETMLLAPVALGVVIYMEVTGKGALGVGQPYQLALLLLAGIFTAIPLGMFAGAASRIPLVTLGILEYIAPSITLVIGIFLFKEPFDLVQFIAFAVIWVGLGFFTVGEIRANKSGGVLDEGK